MVDIGTENHDAILLNVLHVLLGHDAIDSAKLRIDLREGGREGGEGGRRDGEFFWMYFMCSLATMQLTPPSFSLT